MAEGMWINGRLDHRFEGKCHVCGEFTDGRVRTEHEHRGEPGSFLNSSGQARTLAETPVMNFKPDQFLCPYGCHGKISIATGEHLGTKCSKYKTLAEALNEWASRLIRQKADHPALDSMAKDAKRKKR
jgi:hypothetical protein